MINSTAWCAQDEHETVKRRIEPVAEIHFLRFVHRHHHGLALAFDLPFPLGLAPAASRARACCSRHFAAACSSFSISILVVETNRSSYPSAAIVAMVVSCRGDLVSPSNQPS